MQESILELLKFVGVPALLLLLYQKIGEKIGKKRGDNRYLTEGVRSLLRDRLVQAYNHTVHQKGYCPIYEKENITDMYQQYHKLGGNGTVTQLYEEIMELPTQPKGE